MDTLSPIDTLFDLQRGDKVQLPEELLRLYGNLDFPPAATRPYVISNFVSTIDGVVTLGIPGMAGGDAISGSNRHDAMVMGILRAVADAVLFGSGNLAASSKHIWTAEHVFPDLAPAYADLRRRMGKPAAPINVLITASGRIDFTMPVFQSGKVHVLIVTTSAGARLIDQRMLPKWVNVAVAGGGVLLTAGAILDAVAHFSPGGGIFLVEGGPHLMATFFGDSALDELFLTLSPQVAGRSTSTQRLSLVAGRALAPDLPTWGKLVSLKRAENHLFLRYRFKG